MDITCVKLRPCGLRNQQVTHKLGEHQVLCLSRGPQISREQGLGGPGNHGGFQVLPQGPNAMGMDGDVRPPRRRVVGGCWLGVLKSRVFLKIGDPIRCVVSLWFPLKPSKQSKKGFPILTLPQVFFRAHPGMMSPRCCAKAHIACVQKTCMRMCAMCCYNKSVWNCALHSS